jgi:hypothetical protein
LPIKAVPQFHPPALIERIHIHGLPIIEAGPYLVLGSPGGALSREVLTPIVGEVILRKHASGAEKTA